MHLCFVSREYPPNPMGGIGTYVANMTRILAEAGDTVSVLTQDHPDAPTHGFGTPHVSCDGRLRAYYLPFCDANWGILPEARSDAGDALAKVDVIAAFGVVVAEALGELLRVERIDAIEAPEYEAPLLHFQMLRAALPLTHPWLAVPTVVQLHSPSHMIFENDDDPMTGDWVRARKAREAASIGMADSVISPSEFLAEQVSQWLGFEDGRVQVIPYPIGPLLDCPDTRPEPGRCLFVGRVEPRKGVFEFVEAAVDAAARHPEAKFRFVGGPHHRDGLSSGVETASLILERIPEKLRGQFDFAGKVPRETLGAEYAHASFVAVPSRWDNFPNTCMEAMSCGRTVLASDQGGMAEMIENDGQGLVVDGRTRPVLVESLKEGLERMLAKSADELSLMGQNARDRMLSMCDDSAITRIHREFYSGLCSSQCRTEDEDAPAVGVILLDDGAEKARILRAEKAVDGQTVEVANKRISLTAANDDLETKAAFSAWDCVETAQLNEGTEGLPPVLFIGAADDILAPDALRQAANAFSMLPGCGFCSCWTSCRGAVHANFRNDGMHLLAPAKFPERWFFRTEAVLGSGGIAGSGFFLPDILRDLVLRILGKGWRGAALAGPLVDVAPREPLALIKPFAFCERRDSVREVALAHADLFAADLPAASEALTR